MSFLGKVYSFDREENFRGFLEAVGLPEEMIVKFLSYKPTSKLEKDGDEYTYTTGSPAGDRVTKFTSGVELEQAITDEFTVKTTYTVDGNRVKQVITSEKGEAVFDREYNDDELVVTITASTWDGEAKRFYKA